MKTTVELLQQIVQPVEILLTNISLILLLLSATKEPEGRSGQSNGLVSRSDLLCANIVSGQDYSATFIIEEEKNPAYG